MTDFFSNQNVIKILKTTFIGVFAFICAGAGLYFSSCNSNVGLGASVDTEAPTVQIEYPPANSVVRGSLVLAGTCSDDKGVASVKVTIAGYTNYEVPSATLNKDDDGIWWQVEIDTSKIPDGKYAFNAIATDEIGRPSNISERALEIDNHEPVFIIKSPGVTKIESPSSYGTTFKVTGNIADDHDIKTFHIDIYEPMDEKLITSWEETNISVAGGTEVTFAQYDKDGGDASDDSLNGRYRSIYKESIGGDQSFRCTVKIEDAAEQYTTPKVGGGWNNSPNAGSTGNATSKVFLYDDVYTEYMGKTSEYKFTASDFKAIFNGSYTVQESASATQDESRAAAITSNVAQELKAALEKVAIDTSKTGTKLAFKLNKDANPYYEFGGYAIDETNKKYNFSANSASKGSKISFTVKMGLDETLINPTKITAYCFGPFNADTVDAEVAEIYKNPKTYYESHDKKLGSVLFDGATEYKGGTVESFTTTFTMGDISDSKKYVLAAYGKDEDELEIVESVAYGFEGLASGQPPRLTIISPASSDNAVINLEGNIAEKMTVKGTATSAASTIKEIRYDITVYDEGNGNKDVGTITGTATLGAGKPGSDGNTAYDWSFDITKGTAEPNKGYATCMAKEGDNYKYVIRVVAENSLGLEGQADTTLAVDAKDPEISSITLTPIAEETTDKIPVVNGKIKVRFSVSDSYLYKTELKLLQKDDEKDEFVVKYTYPYESAKTFVEEDVDTILYNETDEKRLEFKFEVIATDKAGNSNTEFLVCYIDQSTDYPKVNITGAKDSSVVESANQINTSQNLFSVKAPLSVSVSDDDGIADASIKVYKGELKSEDIGETTPVESKGEIKGATLSHNLPEIEGVYTVVVNATDTGGSKYNKTTKLYYVAVDSGAPKIKLLEPQDYNYFASEMKVVAEITDGSGLKSISVKTGSGDDFPPDYEVSGGTTSLYSADKSSLDLEGKTTYKLEDTILIPETVPGGTYTAVYTVTDIYGQSDNLKVIYNVDKEAPKFSIDSITPNNGIKQDGTENVYYLKADSGRLDVNGTVTDDVALDVVFYYKLSDTPPAYKDENTTEDDFKGWESGTITGIEKNGDNGQKGNWKVNIDCSSYPPEKKYKLYFAFRDKASSVSQERRDGCATIIPDGDKPGIGDFTVVDSIGTTLYDSNNPEETVGITDSNKDATITITVTGVSDSGSGVKSVGLYKNNALVSDVTFNKDTAVEGKWICTLPASTANNSLLTNGKNVFEIKATDNVGNDSVAKSFIISVDTKAPEIGSISISPAVIISSENWYNGKIRVRSSVNEDTDLSSVKWYVKECKAADSDGYADGAFDTLYTAPSSDENKSATMFFTVDFEIDTTKLSGDYDGTKGTGKGSYTLVIEAKDAAGNSAIPKEEILKIDQKTDLPTLEMSMQESAGELLDDEAIVSLIKNNTNTNLFTKNLRTLRGSVTDDDGIKDVTITVTPLDGVGETKNESLGAVQSISYQLPEDEGKYKVVITAIDTNNNDPIKPRSVTQTYYVAIDEGVPTFDLKKDKDYCSTTSPMQVSGTVKDGSKLATLVATLTGTGAQSANYQQEYQFTNDDENPFSIVDTITPPSTDGTYDVTYKAADIYGQENSYKISYIVDSKAPTFTITPLSSASTSVSISGDGTNGYKVYLNKSNGYLKVTGKVTEQGDSGLEKTFYYKLADSLFTPSYSAEEIETWDSSTVNSNDEFSIDILASDSAYTSGTEYTLYIAFKDRAGNISTTDNPTGKIKVIPDGGAPGVGDFTVIDSKGTTLYDSTNPAETVGITDSNKDATITITVTGVSDSGSGVKSVGLYKNNALVNVTFEKDPSVEGKWTCTLPASTANNSLLTNGKNIFEIKATDNVGNDSVAKSFVISVDIQKPEIGSISISPAVTISNGDASENWYNGEVTVKSSVNEDTDLSSVKWYVEECKVDGSDAYTEGAFGTLYTAPSSDENKSATMFFTVDFKIDTTKLSGEYDGTEGSGKGSYTLVIEAKDAAGNSVLKEETLKIDQKTDIPTIDFNDKGETYKDNLFGMGNNIIYATANDDDGIKAISYRFKDTDEWTSYEMGGQTPMTKSISINVSSMPTGDHTIEVEIVDIYDKKMIIPAKLPFAYDNDLPKIDITEPISSSFCAKKVTIKGTASDDSGIASIEGVLTVDGGTSVTPITQKEVIDLPESGTEWTKEITIADTDQNEAATYKWTFTAIDKYGRENEASVSYFIDENAPKFIDEEENPIKISGGKDTYYVSTNNVDNRKLSNVSWFTTDTLKIEGYLEEKNLEGMSIVIAGGESIPFTGAASYSTTNSYPQGVTAVAITATDKAKNQARQPITVNVDTHSPTITGSISDGVTDNYTNTGKVKVTYTVDDGITGDAGVKVSGIKQLLIGPRSGFAENEAIVTKDFDIDSSDGAPFGETKLEAQMLDVDISNKDSGSYTLYARVIDVAGNKSEDALIGNFIFDKEAPTVAISYYDSVTEDEKTTVNKTITINGSVTDNQELSDADGVLQMSKDEGTRWQDVSNITRTGNSWSAELNTVTYNSDGTDVKIKIRAVFTDKAGNKNDDEGTELIINQDGDRPKIKLTNINTTGSSIKQSNEIYGTIDDDDALTDGTKLKNFWIIEQDNYKSSELPSDQNDNGWTKVTVTKGSGAWNYSPSTDDEKKEGEIRLYFYCIDNKGTAFHSNVTKRLESIKVTGVDGVQTDDFDSTKGVSYTADMAAPEVSLAVARGTLSSTGVIVKPEDKAFSEGGMVFSKTAPYSSLYIKLTVIEAVGLKKVGSKFEKPTIKLNSNELTLDDELFDMPSANDEDKPGNGVYVFTVGPIDLATVNDDKVDGQWLLNAEVKDESEQIGASNLNITMDSSAPEILITSPSASISDAVMAAITVKGLAQDAASSIKTLAWAIPEKSKLEQYKTTLGLFKRIGNSTAWEINFSSGSEDSIDSLLFYANAGKDSDSGYFYNVEETIPDSGIYKVPIYFWVEDSVGNQAVQTENADGQPLMVYVDADGGKPKAWINSPENNSDTRVTGRLTIYGGASDNISVDKVEIQVDVNGDGKYDEDDYDLIEGGKLGSVTLEGTRTDSGDKSQNSWHISATGTNSWKVTIDTSTINSGTKIGIRCRAWDAESTPLTRGWNASEEVRVTVDSEAPAIRDVKLVQFGNGVVPTSNPNAQPVAELEYTSGIYISNTSVGVNGAWYLTATVEDNEKVDAVTAEDVNIVTSTHIISLPKDLLTSKYATGDIKTKQIFVPIETKDSGMVYSKLEARDDVNAVASKEIRINIDSTPPSLFKTDNMFASEVGNELRLKPSNSQSALGKNVQVTNSNGLFTFGDRVDESESGLAFLAFYFERDFKKTTPNVKKIFDPMTGKSTEYEDSAEPNKVYKNTDDLPALYLTNVERTGEDSLKIPSGVSPDDKSFIRKGGIVKIGGSYRLITKVAEDTDTVSFTPTCSEDFKTVEIIFAQIVDHQITESVTSDGKVDLTTDDGDGMIESVNHIGSSYIWSASIDSSNIADGPIFVGVAAIDNAGNVAKGRIETAVSNNRPRIAKVLLGTDLSGDNKYNYNASNDMNIVKNGAVIAKAEREKIGIGSDGTALLGEFSYYSGLDGEALQDNVRLASENFKVRNNLVIIPEFVGGNGDLGYVLDGTAGSTTALTAKGDSLDESKFINKGSASLYDQITEKGYVILDNDTLGGNNQNRVIKLTFWDSTDETTQGQNSQYTTLTIPCNVGTQDAVKPHAVITPFYWKSSTDNSVYYERDGESDGSIGGHIEIPEVSSSENPAVSGKVKIEGYVYDDWRLGAISMQFADLGGITTSETLATYNTGTGEFDRVSSLPTGVLSFEAKQVSLNQAGHWATYKLVVDTEELAGIAGRNKNIVVKATDHGNNANASGENVIPYVSWIDGNTIKEIGTSVKGDAGTATNPYTGKPTLTVDVVPYVTEIKTGLSDFYRSAPSVYARTALGRYPVRVGETITLNGFNLGDTPSVSIVTDEGTSVSLGSGKQLAIPTDAVSGSVKVVVGAVEARNNSNDKSAEYNLQPNGVNNNTLNDDLALDVWEFKNAAEPKNGPALQPHMKIGPSGQIGFSYANATYYFSMPGVSAHDGKFYGQTAFGEDYGGFTQNNFAWDQNGNTYGVALCPDTSGAVGMSANLQFFSRNSGLNFNLSSEDAWQGLNSNYWNTMYASRIENTTLKLNGVDIDQNINRIMSPSMTTFIDGNTTYVYVAYYDQLTRQVRFRVGSVGMDANNIGLGLVDLNGYTGQRQPGNMDTDAPKINKDTTRDSISAPSSASGITITYTGNIYDCIYVYNAKGTSSGMYFGDWSTCVADKKLASTKTITIEASEANIILFNSRSQGNDGVQDANTRWDAGVVKAGTYTCSGTSWTGTAIGNSMPSYDGYQYCYVVAANGVSNGTAEYNTATSTRAGQYVAVGSLNNGTAVMSWYDSSKRRLAFSWMDKNDVIQGKTTLNEGTSIWQEHAYYVDDENTNGGMYVSMAVDADNNIHLTYYSANGGDLWYSYIKNPTTSTRSIKTVMVDSYGSVGTYPMIDVARNSESEPFIPYISFRCESNTGTSASVKIAYPVGLTSDNAVPTAGVDASDCYTGAWEVSTLPCELETIAISDFTNIGVNKKWDTGVIQKFENKSDSSQPVSAAFAVSNSTTVYGNGTANPVVAYAVEDGAIEMAQKR